MGWQSFQDGVVAPYTGAWIEIRLVSAHDGIRMSLPTRERGLKSITHTAFNAPDTGRSLHGSVD